MAYGLFFNQSAPSLSYRILVQLIIPKKLGTSYSVVLNCKQKSALLYSHLKLLKIEQCNSFYENHFSELLKNDLSEAVKRATYCIGKKEALCQSITKDASKILAEKHPMYRMSIVAECFTRESPACQYVIEQVYPMLLEKKLDERNLMQECDKSRVYMHACLSSIAQHASKISTKSLQNLASSCITNNRPGCLNIIQLANERLQRDDPYDSFLVDKCIGKTIEGCRIIVENAFNQFVTSPWEAKELAKKCMGSADEVCQSGIRHTVKELFKSDPQTAKLLAKECKQVNDPVSLKIIQETCPLLLKEGVTDDELALNTVC